LNVCQVMSREEREVVAYHECGHALVGWMLKTTDALLKVTIVPRTNHALGFASYLPSDQKLYNTDEVYTVTGIYYHYQLQSPEN